jgi:pimeloyl-ACP methyl ester carboxylesterase
VAPRISKVTLSSGLAVSYASIGRHAGPALVMLPGPTDSWRSYAPVLEELPSSMRSIAVSQRGHGDTDKPPAGYRVEDFANDVPLLLDALDIDRAVIAGHSGSCDLSREVVDEFADELLKVPAHVCREMFQSLLGYDDMDDIPRIAAPTLLVWGDADPLVGRDMQEALAARVPTAEPVVYRGLGHTPRWEDPARFARALAAFTARQLHPTQ